MRARFKLNLVFALGSLVIASLAGAAAQSWLVFWLALLGAIALCYEAGGIRNKPSRRSRRDA